ncbi:MAG: DUF433 domain-containing protein [SAR202 cluster bacterium]|jgi:uncharacterized protein (DUF433 family)|nr:DUF433 domain-containing protein [SAR202 cluster bacterium]MDP7102076.1 DUF433 domain-containing protein [SAR202 cluster bacterium]MDP7412606.1 DUF433 domain-containing protein [SAR202 cluster bacterium]HJO81180.1 DUF433 domain-containing protein [SAR202 cluster bacterium]|tara:strand:- start:2214 stop:2444 length:231 start_codon:yes stop_codon:yes gene_type:complete
MDWRERITADSSVMVGKPVVKGTRITVEFIIQLLGNGWSIEEILDNYPHISEEDIRACLLYTHDIVKTVRGYPLKA